MKSYRNLLFCLISATGLIFTGCEPPVDRNASTSETESASEAKAPEESRPSDASTEEIPEEFRKYTELPKESTPAALKAYLELFESPELYNSINALYSSGDEKSRVQVESIGKIAMENRALAINLLYDSDDAAEEDFRYALAQKIPLQMGTNSTPDAMVTQLKVLRDQVAAGRFPAYAKMVDLQMEAIQLVMEAQGLYTSQETKPEQKEAFFTKLDAFIDSAVESDMISETLMSLVLQLGQMEGMDFPEKGAASLTKVADCLEKNPRYEKITKNLNLRSMISQMEKDAKMKSATPEKVTEFLASYLTLPEKKDAATLTTFLEQFESEDFSELVMGLSNVQNEDVQKALTDEMKNVQKNAEDAAALIMKDASANEAQFGKAFEMRQTLVSAFNTPEERPTFAQKTERYNALKDEAAASKFPQFAIQAECSAESVSIEEKLEPMLKTESEPTPEQLETLQPIALEFADKITKNNVLTGPSARILGQLLMVFRSNKDLATPLLDLIIKNLEGKNEEEAQQLMRSCKMLKEMLENPEMMKQMQAAQNPGAQNSGAQNPSAQAPATPALTPEQIFELKTKFESYLKLPETQTAAALMAYVAQLDAPEFQSVIGPLLQTQDEELQKWLTESMNKLQETLRQALTLACSAEDVTEEQYVEALQYRLDLMRADKARKNIEPDYAALTEEVKAGKFPKHVSMVELDADATELMAKANELFSGATEPTPEQINSLYTLYLPYIQKVVAANALEGAQLKACMQLAGIFSTDDAQITEICTVLLKGLDGKTDEQSKQIAESLKKRLADMEFLSKPMEFTAPEGTDLAELKKLVTEKMEIIMSSMKGHDLPEAKLAEFLAAVEKFGNADLTAYTSWQMDLMKLIPQIFKQEDFDIESFKTSFLECVKTGTEKDLFNINCIQMCFQMARIAGQKSKNTAVEQEMLEALLPACDEVDAPEAGEFKTGIEQRLNELKAPAETPATEALPEKIQLEDAEKSAEAATEPAAPATEEVKPTEPAAPAAEEVKLEEPAAPATEEVKPTEPAAPATEDVKPEETPAPAAEEVKPEETATPSDSTSTTEDAPAETETTEAAEVAETTETTAEKDDTAAKLAPYLTLPEEKTAAAQNAYLTQFETPEFSAVLQTLSQEEIQTVVKQLQQNLAEAAVRMMKADDATEELYRKALELRLSMAFLDASGEALEPEEIAAKITAIQDEVTASKFPKFAILAECSRDAIQLGTQMKPLVEATTPATPEQLDALYPAAVEFVEKITKNQALSGISAETFQGILMVFSSDKERVTKILDLVLTNLEGCETEEAQQWIQVCTMLKSAPEGPAAGTSEAAPQPAESQPAEPQLSAEEINKLKSNFEAFAALPEERTASALAAYVSKVDGPEFRTAAAPLFSIQDPEVQEWLQNAMEKLFASMESAVELICKSEDATQEQYKKALEIRIQILSGKTSEDGSEPNYAALIEEVKASRFPELVSIVELNEISASVMKKAETLFGNQDAKPTEEQMNALFDEYLQLLEKMTAADALDGELFQSVAQLIGVFAPDNAKMEKICRTLLKGLEGKTDENSVQLADALKSKLESIEFLTKPIEFSAPEGTELPELKIMVKSKLRIVLGTVREDSFPDAKLAELLSAVEKFGNADLTAYTAWQIQLVSLIQKCSGDFDADAFKTAFIDCVKTGTEKKFFEESSLQMALSIAANSVQKSGDRARLAELVSELLPACDALGTPDAEKLAASIREFIEQQKNAPADAPDEPAAEGGTTEALPENIDLDSEAVPAESEESAAPSDSTSTTEDESAEDAKDGKTAEDAEADEDEELSQELDELADSSKQKPVKVESATDARPVEEIEDAEDTEDAEDVADVEDAEDAENVESEEPAEGAVPAEVQIPAEILAVITPVENATTEQLAEFLEIDGYALNEIYLQLEQSGNEVMLNAIRTRLHSNLQDAAERVFAAKDATLEGYKKALNFKMSALLQDEKTADDAWNSLKSDVEKGSFAELSKLVECNQLAGDFLKKAMEFREEDSDSAQKKDELFTEYKALTAEVFAQDAFDSPAFTLVLQTAALFFDDNARGLEICKTLLQGIEEKKSKDAESVKDTEDAENVENAEEAKDTEDANDAEDGENEEESEEGEWDGLCNMLKERIQQIELMTQPFEFTEEELASEEKAREHVDAFVGMILQDADMTAEESAKKLDELKNAAKKTENADLNAYSEWQADFVTFYNKALGNEATDDADAAAELASLQNLIERSESVKVSTQSFLMLIQVGYSLVNNAEDAQDAKIAIAQLLVKQAGAYNDSTIQQLIPALESWGEDLKNPESEDSEDETEDADEAEDGETDEDDASDEDGESDEDDASDEDGETEEDEASDEDGESDEDGDDDSEVDLEELDAAFAKYLTLPEEPTCENMMVFLSMLDENERQVELLNLLQKSPRDYAREKVEELFAKIQEASDFILDAEDATEEQLKKVVIQTLIRFNSDEDAAEKLQDLKQRVAAHKFPEITKLVKCWIATEKLHSDTLQKADSGPISKEVEEKILPAIDKVLDALNVCESLRAYPFENLVGTVELLPTPEKQLEIYKTIAAQLKTFEPEPGNSNLESLEGRIRSMEVLLNPASFDAPEGASLEEMKKIAHEQILTFLGIDSAEVALQKFSEFSKSVEAVKNEDLKAVIAWEIDFYRYFIELYNQGDKQPSPNEIAESFAEKIENGTKLDAFQPESAEMALATLNISSSADSAIQTRLTDAVKNLLKIVLEKPWDEDTLSEFQGISTQLNLPGNHVELAAETLDGTPVNIQDFAGKTVLIDVWATWCGPCCEEIPNIREAYDAYHEAGFDVIGLSLDEDLDALKSFVEEQKIPWHIVIQPQKEGVTRFDDLYGITGIPTMFLIGADGKVITIEARGRLMELLAEIYPDVKVPEAEDSDDDAEEVEEVEEVEEAEEAAEAEETDDDTKAEETEDSAESESMSGVEDEAPEFDAEIPEEKIEFAAPENAAPEMLKDAAYAQFMQVLEKNAQDPMEKLTVFMNSVRSYKNDELTQYMEWNFDFMRFFIVSLRSSDPNSDPNTLSTQFCAILMKGKQLNAFRRETMMNSIQFSMMFSGMLDEQHGKELLTTVSSLLDGSSEPWAPQAQRMIDGKLIQLNLPGKPVELAAETLDGKPVNIQDFVGKTVLIDVWATWCGPCCAEIPNVRQAYDAYHAAGFEVIGLSVDRDFEKLKDFVAKEQIPWVIATQPAAEDENFETFSKKYGITGIPTMFLIGADGNVITINARGRLMELLAEIYPNVDLSKPQTDSARGATDAAPSKSMSGVEDAPAKTAAAPAPSVLETYSKLPENKSLESLKEFLLSFERKMGEIQQLLQQMDETSANAQFLKFMNARSAAADAIIADPAATPDDLKLAVDAKTAAILFAAQGDSDSQAADAQFAQLLAALNARKAVEAAIQVEVLQLFSASQFASRMPTTDEMNAVLDKIIAICARTQDAKCMNGDLMGSFMQMISFANDSGVPSEKIDAACAALREAVVATEDPQLLNTADFITGIARRAALAGKPMELVGVTLDGKEVDIRKDYAGKVVLVDFWATWCGPCVMELANLEHQYYAKYHEKGFEILGFSVDSDRNQLSKFLAQRKLPWECVMQKDGAKGCEEPVYYYGIQAIPCLILVGKDGKVIREIPSMRRDEVLTEELNKIYGE